MSEQNNNTPLITQAEFSRLLDIQEQEVKFRAQELALRGQEIDANAKLAEKSIDAQLKSEELKQSSSLAQVKWKGILIATAIICATGILAAAIFFGKDSLAMEIIKQAAVITGSFAGGYALKAHKDKSDE